jgi:hypothetical protein
MAEQSSIYIGILRCDKNYHSLGFVPERYLFIISMNNQVLEEKLKPNNRVGLYQDERVFLESRLNLNSTSSNNLTVQTNKDEINFDDLRNAIANQYSSWFPEYRMNGHKPIIGIVYSPDTYLVIQTSSIHEDQEAVSTALRLAEIIRQVVT